MPNYQNGKIYKLVCNETDQIYIGSTTQTLSKRMGGHRADYKRYKAGKMNYITSFEILKHPSAKILLVRNAPCNSREELEAIEGSFIKNNECVNKIVPGRTPAEYRQENAESIKQKQNQKHKCECGGKYTIAHRKRHFHSKNHISFKKRQAKEFCEVFGLPVSDFNYSIAF